MLKNAFPFDRGGVGQAMSHFDGGGRGNGTPIVYSTSDCQTRFRYWMKFIFEKILGLLARNM